jgi:hypothetical protein
MLKNQKSKNICGAVKIINQHERPYMNSPFSLEIGSEWKAYFRLVSQEAKTMLHVFISLPVKSVQFFEASAD